MPADEPAASGDDPPSAGFAAAQSWIFIPGQSEGCRQNPPDGCHTATVEFTDICGETCTLPFADDVEVMATEVSRGLYRDVMCDCDRVRTSECADVCTERGPSVDVLPMIGLNACGAEAVCAALGGRLPTALERARVQQVTEVDPALFEEMSCDDWRDRIGSAPRVRECIDSGAPLDLVAVDDPRGAIPLGVGVLPTPRLLHHFAGNANEWLASRAADLTCAALRGEAVGGASDATIDWTPPAHRTGPQRALAGGAGLGSAPRGHARHPHRRARRTLRAFGHPTGAQRAAAVGRRLRLVAPDRGDAGAARDQRPGLSRHRRVHRRRAG
ncbi:MAG: hypothetical protein H6705_16500 [Myxococcales bacterium]|nr:hypothetical protein [Myxococcales bacterium]